LLCGTGIYHLPEDVLDAKTPEALDRLVQEISQLDYIVTISTTTTHIAAALGVAVQLIAAERKHQQWFWRVQANHQRSLYPTVRVHLGTGDKNGWWEKSLESLRRAVSASEPN
jgi:ADP-heptose:LPS heptosyltransferase